MTLKSLCSLLMAASLSITAQFSFATQSNAQQPLTINYGSSAGQHLFMTSHLNQSFWPIAHYFVAEKYLTYCGVASAVAVLNALQIKPNADIYHYPYGIFNQQNLFSPAVLKIIPTSSVLKSGMSLEQLASILKAQGAKVTTVVAKQSNYQTFMKNVVATLNSHKQYMIINFYRKAVGQVGDGHFSPIAAYNKHANRILMMDVARYKYPPTWINSHVLWNAINTTDSSNNSRGYLIVSK